MGIIIRNTVIVLGVLACIVIGMSVLGDLTYDKTRSNDYKAKADVKNAYTAAQAYFTDYRTGNVSLHKLTNYGFVQSEGVNLTVLSGDQFNLKITASHSKGKKTYTIDSDGKLSKQK